MGCDLVYATTLSVYTIDNSVDALDNTLTAQAGVDGYQWIDCNTEQEIAGATEQSFTPDESGSYAVVLTDGECERISDCFDVVITSTIERDSNELTIYPNPSSGFLQIDGVQDEPASIRLISMNGQATLVHLNYGQSHIQLPSSVSAGFYSLEIITGSKVYRELLLVTD